MAHFDYKQHMKDNIEESSYKLHYLTEIAMLLKQIQQKRFAGLHDLMKDYNLGLVSPDHKAMDNWLDEILKQPPSQETCESARLSGNTKKIFSKIATLKPRGFTK